MGSSPGRSAFGGYVSTPPYTLLDSIPLYGLDTDLFGTDVAGAGSIANNLDASAVELAVTAAAPDYAMLRSHEHYRYQAGKGQRIIQSLWMDQVCPAGQVRRWGLYDEGDGVFFEEREGGVLYGICRSSTSGAPVEREIALATGADTTKGNIYEISFQWLGVGSVTFMINGRGVGSFDNAGQLSVPYMKTAYLQASAEVVNTGAAAVGQMNMICNHIRSEGGEVPPSKTFAARNSAPVSPAGTLIPALSIRLATLFKTVENRVVAFPTYAQGAVDGSGSQRMEVDIYLNAALTGAAWTAADAESAVEYDETATALTGGTLVGTITTATSEERILVDLRDVFNINKRALNQKAFSAGSDILTIAVKSLAGSPSITASLGWDEVR